MLVQTQWTASCSFLSLEPVCVVSAQTSPRGCWDRYSISFLQANVYYLCLSPANMVLYHSVLPKIRGVLVKAAWPTVLVLSGVIPEPQNHGD